MSLPRLGKLFSASLAAPAASWVCGALSRRHPAFPTPAGPSNTNRGAVLRRPPGLSQYIRSASPVRVPSGIQAHSVFSWLARLEKAPAFFGCVHYITVSPFKEGVFSDVPADQAPWSVWSK